MQVVFDYDVVLDSSFSLELVFFQVASQVTMNHADIDDPNQNIGYLPNRFFYCELNRDWLHLIFTDLIMVE